jgi:hypothetical protein
MIQEGMVRMRPLQISPETAVKLAEQLKVPLEHLMHMPQHILLAKLAELAKNDTAAEQAPAQKEKRKEE